MEQQSRERILTAAKSVFSEKGFDGARMGEIARKAKVNQAMLHYYFQSKEHLFEEVLHGIFDVKRVAMLIELVKKFDLEPSQRLYLGIYLIYNLNCKPASPEFERMLYIMIGKLGIKKFISLMKKFFLPIFELMEDTIKAGINSGEFESHDTTLSALNIFYIGTHMPGSHRFFDGTKWEDHLNRENIKKDMFDYLIWFAFKGLLKPGRDFRLPALPDNIMSEVNEKIKIFIKDGGFNE